METSENQSRTTLLKLERIAPEIYKSLHDLKRTGWVNRGVENPESVKEHTEELLSLVAELSPLLSAEETDGLIEMLEVHDWPEAVHGDEVILEVNPDDLKPLKALKFENERKALEIICKDLPNGQEIMNLWLRFETSDDPAAVFGRQLDKYQAVEKALEYEETQGIPLFEEFLKYSLNFIDHPVLLERIEQLKSRRNG
jgi:putative hydrolases of HD superfamily